VTIERDTSEPRLTPSAMKRQLFGGSTRSPCTVRE
jgi:hypothetical protein